MLNYIIYHNVYHDYFGVFIEKHLYIKFHLDCCVSELYAHLCSYHNVWPEAVHTLFTNNLKCRCTRGYRFLSVYSFVSQLYPVFEICELKLKQSNEMKN